MIHSFIYVHLLVSMGVAYILIDVNIHIPVSEIQDGNGGTHTQRSGVEVERVMFKHPVQHYRKLQ